jgi:hypothetical protein
VQDEAHHHLDAAELDAAAGGARPARPARGCPGYESIEDFGVEARTRLVDTRGDEIRLLLDSAFSDFVDAEPDVSLAAFGFHGDDPIVDAVRWAMDRFASADLDVSRIHPGSRSFRIFTEVRFWLAQKAGHFHQTTRWEPATTSRGRRAPFLVGCHCRATAGAMAVLDRPTPGPHARLLRADPPRGPRSPHREAGDPRNRPGNRPRAAGQAGQLSEIMDLIRVEAPGIEPPRAGTDRGVYRTDRGITSDATSATQTPNSAKSGDAGDSQRNPAELVDVVDAALAAALERAATAGQWSTVALLAGELAARRTARTAPTMDNVVDLAAERAKRER